MKLRKQLVITGIGFYGILLLVVMANTGSLEFLVRRWDAVLVGTIAWILSNVLVRKLP